MPQRPDPDPSSITLWLLSNSELEQRYEQRRCDAGHIMNPVRSSDSVSTVPRTATQETIRTV